MEEDIEIANHWMDSDPQFYKAWINMYTDHERLFNEFCNAGNDSNEAHERELKAEQALKDNQQIYNRLYERAGYQITKDEALDKLLEMGWFSKSH